MGNNKFKLSDMIPNAWFYKLKDMSKSRKRNVPPPHHVMKNKVTSSPTISQRSHYFSIEPTKSGKLFNTPIHNKKDCDIPFNDSPRRSSKRRTRRKTVYKPSKSIQVESPDYDLSSNESSFESDFNHEYAYSESDYDDGFSVPDLLNGVASNCSCRVSSSTNDIIIDMNNESFQGNSEFDATSKLGLAPILTKSVKFDDKIVEDTEFRSSTESDELLIDQIDQDRSFSIKEVSSRSQRRRKSSHIGLAPILTKSTKYDEKIIEDTEFRSSTESDELLIDQNEFFSIKEKISRNQRRRKSSTNSNGIKLRVNSPKLVASKKIQACARKSVSTRVNKNSKNEGFPDGFAVVKSSMDPISDFKESMVEMIVENNIRASKDLEDLLACYLSLNSSEYHDLIVKAFEQIWYDMAQLRM